MPELSSVNQVLRKCIKLKDVCQMTGLSASTIRRRVRDGSLPAVQLGGRGCRLLFDLVAIQGLASSSSAVQAASEIALQGNPESDSQRSPATEGAVVSRKPRAHWPAEYQKYTNAYK